ncbi:hypothetical protein ALC60_06396 [Trachymyrmex zeteki]|uniref:Uncharacterized protein n=1 Tax=Mycetomoellerius zeteki TaxID=64791 RepID=A0A151X3E6_9HYME|nr:hypothetical protein ALC60_06396 [Trachymyrmex zeteki]
MNQIRVSLEGFLPEEEKNRKREAVGVRNAPDCRSYDPRKFDHDYQNREVNDRSFSHVTESTKWQMDGLGTELTALYAFLEGKKRARNVLLARQRQVRNSL